MRGIFWAMLLSFLVCPALCPAFYPAYGQTQTIILDDSLDSVSLGERISFLEDRSKAGGPGWRRPEKRCSPVYLARAAGWLKRGPVFVS
jgi:hypothetical protein